MHADNVRIAKPCTADWDSMSGDERKRFCGQCREHVTDLSAMTEREARGVVKTGRCVQYRTDSTGQILFKQSRAAVLVGLLGALSAPAMASGVAAEAGDSKSLTERLFEWWTGSPEAPTVEAEAYPVSIPEVEDTRVEPVEVVIPEVIEVVPVVEPEREYQVKGKMAWHPPVPRADEPDVLPPQ